MQNQHLTKILYQFQNGKCKHFSSAQNLKTIISEDMNKFKKPTVGYIGSIFQWLDIEGIDFAAKNLSPIRIYFYWTNSN